MKLRIKDLRKKIGMTQTELANALGVSSVALHSWEVGKKTPSLARSAQIADILNCSIADLVEDASEFSSSTPFDTNLVLLPVYGEVSAGLGTNAEDHIICYADASSKYATGEYFYLKAKGDSMMPYIIDGDLLLVKRTPSVDNGKVAVMLIDGEDGVVKKVIYDKHTVTLLSYNPDYPPRIFKDEEKQRLLVIGEVISSKTEVMP